MIFQKAEVLLDNLNYCGKTLIWHDGPGGVKEFSYEFPARFSTGVFPCPTMWCFTAYQTHPPHLHPAQEYNNMPGGMNPKDSNVCRMNKHGNGTTPSGSHFSSISLFYKHEIPPGLKQSAKGRESGACRSNQQVWPLFRSLRCIAVH